MITENKLIKLQKKADNSIKKRKYLGDLNSTYYDEQEKTLYITNGYFAFCAYNVEDAELLKILEPSKEVMPAVKDVLKNYAGLKIDVPKINLGFGTTNIGDYWYDNELVELLISTMGKKSVYSYEDLEVGGRFSAENNDSKMIILSLRKGCKSL